MALAGRTLTLINVRTTRYLPCLVFICRVWFICHVHSFDKGDRGHGLSNASALVMCASARVLAAKGPDAAQLPGAALFARHFTPNLHNQRRLLKPR